MPPHRLTAAECGALGNLASLLDCDRIRLFRRDTTGPSLLLRRIVLWASRDRSVALGNWVFLPDHCDSDLPILAHELTHCGQFQAWGVWRYFGKGLVAQLRDLLYRKAKLGTSPYRYTAEPGKPFAAYGMEQQGQIVEDCFRGHPEARAISPFQPGEMNSRPYDTPSA